ncbi:MAG: DUF4976 domain-containing protein, partial [Bacteroidaceae bacterium]|nr:DUF4976 domain-containing protein [Bacteroidaceae bacterium]
VSLPTGFDFWNIVPEQGDYYNPDFITMQNDTVREEGYITNIITNKAIDWMSNRRDKGRPFALFIHHKACHRNWLPEMKYLYEYEDKTFPLPATLWDNYEGRIAAQTAEMNILKHMDIIYDNKMLLPGQTSRLKDRYLHYLGRLDTEGLLRYDTLYNRLSRDFYSRKWTDKELMVFKYQRYMRDYAKVLKSLDDEVGRTLDYLKEQGLLDNTLVVYTSDQGFYMGEHGWFDKRFMYEESLNTPLVMMLPKGLKRRGVITDMVQNIDYAPTFLDLAGASIPTDIQGRSLLPLLKGAKSPKKWRDAVYYHFYEYPAEHSVKRHYGVRTQRYSLIHFYNDIDVWELYDLQEDPAQLRNIYDTADPKLIKTLKAKLIELQMLYDDEFAMSKN